LASDASDEVKITGLKKIIAQINSKASGGNAAATSSSKPAAAKNTNFRDSLVIVAGAKGAGSAFVAELDGRKFLITNIHVLMGNEEVRFLDCSNNELDIKAVGFAPDRDIAIIELDEQCKLPALTMEKDVSKCRDKEKIVVAGNSQGAGSLVPLPGEVKGIGPKVVEVTAPFVQGNSGSPIVSQDTGSVIGVATFAVRANTNWVNAGSGFDQVRRFGTRVDNLDLTTLEEYNKRWYSDDLALYKRLKNVNETAIHFIKDIRNPSNKGMSPEGAYQNDLEMQRIVRRWNDALANPRFGSSYMNALADVVKHVEAPAKTCRARKIHYSFIQEEIKHHLELNDALVTGLRGLRTTLDDYRRRMSSPR